VYGLAFAHTDVKASQGLRPAQNKKVDSMSENLIKTSKMTLQKSESRKNDDRESENMTETEKMTAKSYKVEKMTA
jgi:hypothetical protein